MGLENYFNIFKDELFVQSFLNTVKFVIIIVPCQCIGALVLALAINKAAHCKKYFKVAFFVPVVMSLAVVSTLWMQIYSPEGILNTLLANFGIDAQPLYPQRQPGAALHRHHERMAGSGIPDDHFPGRAAEHQPGPLRGGGDGSRQRLAEIQGHHSAGAEAPVCVRVHHSHHRRVPHAGTAHGHDRRRTGPTPPTPIVYDIYETGTVNWEMGLASTMAIVFTVFVVILTIIQNVLTKDKEEKKHGIKKAKAN